MVSVYDTIVYDARWKTEEEDVECWEMDLYLLVRLRFWVIDTIPEDCATEVLISIRSCIRYSAYNEQRGIWSNHGQMEIIIPKGTVI